MSFLNILRILTGKKHPQIKPQRFRKVCIWTFRWLVNQINTLYEVLKLKQNFRKNKVVIDKSPFFVIRLSRASHSICLLSEYLLLTGQFCTEMLRFQSWFFQLKIGIPVFWKRFTFLIKLFSKLNYWKRSKFSVVVT